MRGASVACLCALALVAAPGCARVLYNAAPVVPHSVYRSAQPGPLFLARAHAAHGFRTLVNLRGRTPGHESAFAAAHGIRLHVLDLSASRPPTEAQVARFLAILSDPGAHPVLVHCRNGVDRTGYMIGLYRRAEGWTADRATAEMRRFFQFATLNPVPQGVVNGDVAPSER